MSKPSENTVSPTRVRLIAMVGDLVAAAQKLTMSGHAAPEQQEFLRGVGRLAADMAQWPEEEFTFEDGVVYVIIDRMAVLDKGIPLLCSSGAAAETYCRARMDTEFGEGKYLFADKEMGGVVAYYANGRECFNVMPEVMVG